MRKYHVFFTTQFTKECLDNCCFGASVSNSLANVKAGDIAFLFDGSKWAIFGPFEIISDQQRVDDRPIYGRDNNENVKYKNRVWFKINEAKITSLTKLYSLERIYTERTFTLNRYLLATLIANKQVNSTPLTQREGIYLMDKCSELGQSIPSSCAEIPQTTLPVFPNSIIRRPLSEAAVEVLILNRKYQGALTTFLASFSNEALYLNQFVLGFQRQVDILIDANDKLALLEIKKSNNAGNPFDQLIEYAHYGLSSFRLQDGRLEQLKSIYLAAVLERGNNFLNASFVWPFFKGCEEMSKRESVMIIPQIINYRFSNNFLETTQYSPIMNLK